MHVKLDCVGLNMMASFLRNGGTFSLHRSDVPHVGTLQTNRGVLTLYVLVFLLSCYSLKVELTLTARLRVAPQTYPNQHAKCAQQVQHSLTFKVRFHQPNKKKTYAGLVAAYFSGSVLYLTYTQPLLMSEENEIDI